MRSGIAGALVLGLLAATAGAGFAEAERGVSAPSVERRGGRTFVAAGYSTMFSEGPSGESYEIDAAVWLPAKKAKGGVHCFGFTAERFGTETLVTASCDPRNGRGKLAARFEVRSTVWGEDQVGTVVDRCVDHHDMRKDTTFSCLVTNPDAAP